MQPSLAITLTSGLLSYAWYKQSLTTVGLVAAALTATAHAYHFWNVFYGLLGVFFLSGTFVTKVSNVPYHPTQSSWHARAVTIITHQLTTRADQARSQIHLDYQLSGRHPSSLSTTPTHSNTSPRQLTTSNHPPPNPRNMHALPPLTRPSLSPRLRST